MVQELTQNVVKHAGASKARINLEAIAGRIKTKVLDYGLGFDRNEPAFK